MSTAAQRAKRREELDRAYGLQTKAAAWVRLSPWGSSRRTSLLELIFKLIGRCEVYCLRPLPCDNWTFVLSPVSVRCILHFAAAPSVTRYNNIYSLQETDTCVQRFSGLSLYGNLVYRSFVLSLSYNTAVTMFGLVVGADTALLSHERSQRIAESAIRREARLDLARRGIVGTETEIAKWKEAREARLAAERSMPPPQSSTNDSAEHPTK